MVSVAFSTSWLGNTALMLAFSSFETSKLVDTLLVALSITTLLTVLVSFPDGWVGSRWSLAIPVVCGFTLAYIGSDSLGFGLCIAVGIIAAVGVVTLRYRAMPAGPDRQQLRWVMVGFGWFVVATVLSSVIPVSETMVRDVGIAAWLDIATRIAAGAANALPAAFITIALLRYRLYDADATASYSVVYGALTILLLGIFAGSEKAIELLGEGYLGERFGLLASGLSAGIAAICIGPLHHRVMHWSEKRFRSGLAHLRHGLPLLMGDMRETASPARLADVMLLRVEKGVRARHAAVVVDGALLDIRDIDEAVVRNWLAAASAHNDHDQNLVRDRADPIFPMRVPLRADGVGLVGWLLLGPRPDGSFYGREERAALEEIADPVARALSIAMTREEREGARDREIARLGGIVDALQKRLGFDVATDGALA